MRKSMKEVTPLNSYEQNMLTKARQLIPSDPPAPWRYVQDIEAPSLIAAGWDPDENLVLISQAGYSINVAHTRKQLLLDLDADVYTHLTERRLRFHIPKSQTTINVFGVTSGDGIHYMRSGEEVWILNIIYPWWPRGLVTLRPPVLGGRGLWKKTTALKLLLVGGEWMRCGFSPSGEHFVVIGSQGAEVFTRRP